MEKMRMNRGKEKTLQDGVNEYLADCRGRNLREGTIRHYRDGSKQIVKYIGAETKLKDLSYESFQMLIIKLNANPQLNNMSVYTYARDFETLLLFFQKKGYTERFLISLAEADTKPIETYTDDELRKLLKKPKVSTCSFAEYKKQTRSEFQKYS